MGEGYMEPISSIGVEESETHTTKLRDFKRLLENFIKDWHASSASTPTAICILITK
jgi:hypothetical protein